MLKETFNFDSYEKADKTVSLVTANVFALVMFIPAVLCFALYVYVWKTDTSALSKIHYIILFIVYFAVLTVLHEFTHGAVMGLFCKNKRGSIKYGFDKKTLSPYCHCEEVLTVNQLRAGYAAPLFTTGILPFLIALAIGHFPLMLASFFLILGAGGDYMIIFILMNEKKTAFAEDHPSLVGCIVYRPIKREDF